MSYCTVHVPLGLLLKFKGMDIGKYWHNEEKLKLANRSTFGHTSCQIAK